MGHKHLPGDDPENSAVGGFIRTRDDRGGAPSVRLIRPQDLSQATEATGVAMVLNKAARDESRATKGHGQVWPKVSQGRKRKTKLAVMGISTELLDKGDPDYARCVRLATKYRKSRAAELANSHEYVSSGVSSLLATASLALAASRYLYEKASAGGELQLQLFKTAQGLADSARQNELAAWELAARESQARRKMTMIGSGIPWVVTHEEQRPRRGPKSAKYKADLVSELPPVGEVLTQWEPQGVAEVKIDRGDIYGPEEQTGISGEESR